MVLNLKDEFGKRAPKWIPTHLPVKGNKRKAEAMLLETRKEYTDHHPVAQSSMLFADLMQRWLKSVKGNVEANTFGGYQSNVNARIDPYFRMKGIRLNQLKMLDIQDFYDYCRETYGVSNNTLGHYHVNMNAALKYAVCADLLERNPMEKVKKPKPLKHIQSFYSLEETETLLRIVKGDGVELPVLFAVFYGLRCSEICGLTWKAIDFKNNRITIRQTVVQTVIDGDQVTITKPRTKNQSSYRSLPLVPQFRDYLLQIKTAQEENKRLCGDCYHQSDFVYVNAIGQRIKPDYITSHFANLLKKHELPKITFHELRHSCASILLKHGVSMKEIQNWLGHSTYHTTANIYAHLDPSSNENVGQTMANTLDIAPVMITSKKMLEEQQELHN